MFNSRVIDDALVKAMVMRRGLKAHFLENGCGLVVPMEGAATEPIKSFAKKPVLVRGVPWVADRRPYNGEFVIREVHLTKCILAVALPERRLACA